MKTMLRLGTALALVAGTGTAAFAGPEVVAGPGADPECFAPWSAETKYLQWPAQGRPLPHRHRQRLRRQHLAHPDDQDRQGLRRGPGGQGQDRRVQGRLDRHRRAGPARRHRGLHQPGLRRHRHHRRLARRLRPRDPPRRQERRRHRALRQRARHRRGDAGQRGPARDGPQVGAVPRRRAQGRRARPAARSSRSAACPATRSTATARSASTRCSTPPAATGRSSRSSATGTTAPRRR